MFKIALKYGVLIVVFIFIWVSLEYFVGLHTDYIQYHPIATLLSLIIPLVLLYYAMRESQKKFEGNFNYIESFKTGVIVTFVVAILSPLTQWLFHAVVFPGYFDSMRAYTEAHALAQGIDPVVAREEAVGEFNMASYLMRTFLGALVAGVVMSAILALFVRDKELPKGG